MAMWASKLPPNYRTHLLRSGLTLAGSQSSLDVGAIPND